MRSLLTLIVLAPLAAFPAGAAATWPGEPGQIVYQGLDDADDEGARDGIYSINADGSGNRRIARRSDGGVASSPDGQRIAFFRAGRELWEARSDGSAARRIVRLKRGESTEPAWSPSGKQLVFTRTVKRRVRRKVVEVDQVWRVNSEGSGLRKLRRGRGATWSSRGLIGYAEADGAVATMRPDGRGRRIWVPQGSPVFVTELDFSSDGQKLVYQQSTRRSTKNTIRTIDLDTRARTSFPDHTDEVSARDVVWVPGEHRLAYVHTAQEGSGRSEHRTILPDGTGNTTIFEFPSGLTPFAFAWQTR
jgi:Tol biopolymer transport system component